jgi:hypothetical protein
VEHLEVNDSKAMQFPTETYDLPDTLMYILAVVVPILVVGTLGGVVVCVVLARKARS